MPVFHEPIVPLPDLIHGDVNRLLQAPTTFGAANLFSPDDPMKSGPIISDVTDISQSSPSEIADEWTEERSVPCVHAGVFCSPAGERSKRQLCGQGHL